MKYAESTIRKHRKKWLDALESGDYSQVKGYLVKTKQGSGEPMGYCCLGVAATLAGVPCENMKGDSEVNYRFGLLYFEDGAPGAYEQAQLLPDGAAEWLGLTTDDPCIAIPRGHKRNKHGTRDLVNLVTLNDNGVKFGEIAALIREFGFVSEHDMLKQKVSV